MYDARQRLVAYFGDSYGRAKLMWLCQKHGVYIDQEVPAEMMQDVEKETAPKVWKRS